MAKPSRAPKTHPRDAAAEATDPGTRFNLDDRKHAVAFPGADAMLEVVRKYQDGTPEEREQAEKTLIHGNTGLIATIIHAHYRGLIGWNEHEDAVQEGRIAILEAAKNFDFSRGVRFSTHAAWQIRRALTEFCRSRGGSDAVHVPAYIDDDRMTVNKAESALFKRGIAKPTRWEIREEIIRGGREHWPLYRVARTRKARMRRSVSLDEPVRGDEPDGMRNGDTLTVATMPAQGLHSPEGLERQLRATAAGLDALFDKKLGWRDLQIIRLRWALVGTESPQTLEAIAERLGLSRERIRQIEARIRRRTVGFLGKKGVEDFETFLAYWFAYIKPLEQDDEEDE